MANLSLLYMISCACSACQLLSHTSYTHFGFSSVIQAKACPTHTFANRNGSRKTKITSRTFAIENKVKEASEQRCECAPSCKQFSISATETPMTCS